MTTVYAQAAGEYAGASSVAAVVVERFNSAYTTVSISVGDHPIWWGVGLSVALYLLFRRK
jgi:hypothetical protein